MPGADTRPTSLRPRSISITCSASSFGSAAQLGLQRRVLLGRCGRAGACRRSGRTSTSPPSSRTSTSGEAPVTTASGNSRWNMYGDGFITRSAR